LRLARNQVAGARVASVVPRREVHTRRREQRPSLKEIAGRAVAEAERQAIQRALHATHGNMSEAARLLQVDYKTLHLKMKQYGIPAALFEDITTHA
jgi:DNA-binding NtrC family response regulator